MVATFAMLDQFSARFAVSKEWLASGRGEPFLPPVEHQRFPEEYLGMIDEEKPETVYAVRSKSSVGEAFIVVKSDPMKVWCLPDVWHVSNHVGGTGARDLASLYTLFKHWSKAVKPYTVIGRYVEPALAKSIIDGVAYPGIVSGLPLNHWWDDLTDIEHKWTTRKGSSKAYGKEFVAAQDIIREMFARLDP